MFFTRCFNLTLKRNVVVLWLLLGAFILFNVLADTSCVYAATSTIKPLRFEKGIAVYSTRTLSVAVDVHRDGASIKEFTYHDRKFIHPPESNLSDMNKHDGTHLLFSIKDDKGRVFQIKKTIRGLCLRHGANEPPHIMGDTIEVHRDTVVVELPAIAGAQYFEVSNRYDPRKEPRSLVVEPLDSAKFVPATPIQKFEDLNFSPPPQKKGKKGKRQPIPTKPQGMPLPTNNGSVTWPAPGEPTYKVWGNEDQTNSRINVVIVPDGYQSTQKALMETNAQDIVNAFRSTTPFMEHDTFFNYILVYAYSNDSGTTQCDCNINENTAMATFFPKVNPTCGSSDNRCLYYGNGSSNCNPASVDNISTAELRAPAHDATIVMVNTPRYGGCGGYRAVYSAGNGSAKLIGIHELGHSLGGLADEYSYNSGCGASAGEVNTSKNATTGAWPEWIADIGAPRVGAQYYQQCLYRPENNCMMRELGPPFCHVCNQQWALRIFSKLNATAPVSLAVPDYHTTIPATVGNEVVLGISTYFPISTAGNSTQWSITGGSAGCYSPTPPSGDQIYRVTFSCTGSYNVTATATADQNFIKQSKYGANRKTITWTVNVTQ